jgi:hypothetical protein
MDEKPVLPTRLKAGSPGLGEPSATEVERRAAELARSDGRSAFNDADLARAAAELTGDNPATGEAEAVDQVTPWDSPAGQAGRQIKPVPLEDETHTAERLIQEGIAEADHDTRVAAEEENGP